MHRYVAITTLALIASAALFLQPRIKTKVEASSQRRVDRHHAILSGPAGEQTMEIYGFSHEVVSPRDAASGLPTGKRQHKPFTVTKPVDKTSASLLGAMLAAENVGTVTVTSLRFKRGRWMPYRKIQLDEVYVRSVGQKPSPADDRPTEEVAFYYNKITWSYEGGVEHTDNWREAN